MWKADGYWMKTIKEVCARRRFAREGGMRENTEEKRKMVAGKVKSEKRTLSGITSGTCHRDKPSPDNPIHFYLV